MKFGAGQAVRRIEDDTLLRGGGRYVSDHLPDGARHGVVVRSPHAHATFRIENLASVQAMPGVRLVLTAAETKDLGDLPCFGDLPSGKVQAPPYPVLAADEVRHVGDAIAFVVADTLGEARDAADALAVIWEAMPQVTGAEAAVAAGAPLVWRDRPGNVAFEATLGEAEGTTAAFASAARVVSLRLVNQRVVTNYLDTRAVVAEHDAGSGRTTLTLGSQGSHLVRDVLAETILKVPADKLRVITPDVGGGFGTKFFPYREYALAAVAAQRTDAPVKWVAERSEHFLADTHGRDNITAARLALDEDNRFLALEIDTLADMGAYLSCYAPFIPYIGAEMLPGVYDIPACHIRIRGVYTNTVPVDAYRGAGRPEAAYVIERVVDAASRELGVAPDTLRQRNFIKPKAMPYTTATGKVYDSGAFAAHMARAKEIGDWKGFGKRAAASKKAGRLRGIGLATYIEACGSGGETAQLRLEHDGTVTVLIGTQSSGQGHRTAYAQLIADHLGLSPDAVRLVQGDTDVIATGGGTGGSCSIPIGGVCVEVAAKTLAVNLKKLAADMLEASASDLEIDQGRIRVVGTDRAVTFAEIARHPKATPELLQAAHKFATDTSTFPNGTHLAEVEIDGATGATAIVSYVVVDDFGVTLNPLMLEGQVHGGAVQGIGQALMENTIYDPVSGQLASGSLMDYALPRAAEMPSFVFETANVRCRTNPLGVKGAGEAGAIGSCPSVLNAIADALWRAGRSGHVDMPATPERVWAVLQGGKSL